MSNARWLAPITLTLACSPSGSIDGFGGVKDAYIVPCDLVEEDGTRVPSAFGLVFARRRSCIGGPGDLIRSADPSDVGCDGWSGAVADLGGTCVNSASNTLRDGLTFTLGEVADRSDLTGAVAEQVEHTECSGGSLELVKSDLHVAPAAVSVVDDDGTFADVAIDGDEYTGIVRAEVCR